MADVVMPRLSDSMEEGTILKWLKASGDPVARGDELVEIETDKANMTYEADAGGVLEIVAQEGATLPIGELIARLDGPGGGSPEAQAAGRAGPVAGVGDVAAEPATSSHPAPPARSAAPASGPAGTPAASPTAPPIEPTSPAEATPPQATPDAGPATPPAGPASAGQAAPAPGAGPAASPSPAAVGGGAGHNGRIKASPVARRLASELGVDLTSIAGTGPGGRIVKADVEARAAAPAAAPAKPAPGPVVSGEAGTGKGEATSVELTRVQQTIARRMAESKATVPDFAITTEVDMVAAVSVREQLKALADDTTPAPSFNDMVMKAAAHALREFPRANGSYRDGHFELYSRVNVGIAVAAQDALIVPTVFDADRKSLGEIAAEARALAARVRSGDITPPELSGGTFTVSNLGMFGVTEFTAIINGGQAAILAVGALREAPVVKDGQIVAGKRMNLTLVCDHRILYGADAAQFLARIRALLESPLALAL